jgi:krueppel-like factor 5
MLCSEHDDPFMRPPLWEDITSSIQNIDPENAIMLGSVVGATQVKLEVADESFLEPLSSPLLSPLEIKAEKTLFLNHLNSLHDENIHHNPNHQMHHNNNNNNNSHNNLNNNSSSNSYLVSGTNYQHHQPQQQQQQQQHNINGYVSDGTNGSGNINMHIHHPQQQQQQQQQQQHHQQHNMQNNNYYNWHQNQSPVYQSTKYPPQQVNGNMCTSMQRLMYAPPLTPPSSDPGSPGNSMQVSLAQR